MVAMYIPKHHLNYRQLHSYLHIKCIFYAFVALNTTDVTAAVTNTIVDTTTVITTNGVTADTTTTSIVVITRNGTSVAATTTTPAATNVVATPTTTTTTTTSTTTATTTTTTGAIIATDTYNNFNTLINSHIPNLASQSDNNNSSSITVAVIVAITVLILILCILIILVMIGIIILRKSRQHTKPEEPYYSTIDEIKLQRPLKTKQETAHGKMNDVQVNKEEPTYIEMLENPQYTTSGNVTLQSDQSHSVSSNNQVDIPSHNIPAKLQDNPSYAISSQTIN